MKVTKIGHCCLLIELETLTILTDPGAFSQEQNHITGINVVLITHEHGDHLHIESLKQVIKNNPDVQVYTNTATGKLLDGANIPYILLEGRDSISIQGTLIEACDAQHVEIFEDIGQVQNTGYFIADKLFYPGDAYANPEKPVEILTLPVAGPWARVADVIRYARDINPQRAFPVHDALLNEKGIGSQHKHCARELSAKGIDFISMSAGESHEF
ncbi:MBL fold metallo-hydrolase [Patescibacteria group bacterium]|nr:MBL fold metallo-hydrolase [Patescibacteria group bacterium]